MITKIIDLLWTEDPKNWELAIQISKSLGLCKIVAKRIISSKHRLLFLFLDRFTGIPNDLNLDTITTKCKNLDRCGLPTSISFRLYESGKFIEWEYFKKFRKYIYF